MTFWWPPDDCLMTAWWLPHDWLMTILSWDQANLINMLCLEKCYVLKKRFLSSILAFNILVNLLYTFLSNYIDNHQLDHQLDKKLLQTCILNNLLKILCIFQKDCMNLHLHSKWTKHNWLCFGSFFGNLYNLLEIW